MGYSTTHVSKEVLKNIKRFAYVSIPEASSAKFIIGNAFAVLKKYYKDVVDVQVSYDKDGIELYAYVILKNGDWFVIEASEMVGVNPADPVLQSIAEKIAGKNLVSLRPVLETMFKKKEIDFEFMGGAHYTIKTRSMKDIVIIGTSSADAGENDIVVDGNKIVGYL